MSFRWQTDDEADDAFAPQPSPAPSHSRRRLYTILVILSVLLLSALISWRTLRQRTMAAAERVEDDVLSIHELARSAVASGDDELYLSLLPPHIVGWAETQQQLLGEDLLFTGVARLYGLAPGDDGGELEVTLDPSLSQAIVATRRTFVFTPTRRLEQNITLRQFQSYSLNDGTWHVAPPPPDFWSPQIELHGDRVTLHFPQRDEAVSRRLMTELERQVPQACALPGIECPPDLRLIVRLVPDPAAVVRAAAPDALLRGSLQLDLPAPSLVGQPLDEAGEAFVARTYAARAIAPLISHLSGYDCCARSLLVRAILERQLHHLGLRPWSLTPDDYEALMEQGLTLGNALVLQVRDVEAPLPGTWRQMLSLVEFLEDSLAPGELLNYMEASFDYWLLRANEPGHFVVQWTDFVYDRSLSARLAGDLDPLPRGAIQLTCFESGAVAVQRYDLQSATWQHGLTYVSRDNWQVESVFPLPADYGDVIKETRRDPSGERMARYLWQHAGGARVLFETMPGADGARLFSPYDGTAPHWRYTVLSSDQPALRASLEQEWWQLDLTTCDGGSCQVREQVVRPHWSPNGAKLLLEARAGSQFERREEFTLFRAGSRGQNAIEIGRGHAPVWVDNVHYAFLRAADAQSGQELIVAATDDDAAYHLAATNDFVTLLDEDMSGGRALQLERLQSHPTDPSMLLVKATRPPMLDPDPDSFLFTVRLANNMRQIEEIELIFHGDGYLDVSPSPNGRWVVAGDAGGWRLLDLQGGEARQLGGSGTPMWSPDGNWLAQSRDYHIMLLAPSVDYKRPIVHELGDCPFSSLYWQSR